MSFKSHSSGCIAMITAALLAACGDAYRDAAPPPANPQGPANQPEVNHGYHAGLIDINGTTYFADAIVTVDGNVYLYVGGPHAINSYQEMVRPAHSAQFSGRMQIRDMQTHATVSGTGIVTSQNCTPPAVNKFCVENSVGALSVTIAAGRLTGELRVTTSQSTEVWLLQLAAWPLYYVGPAETYYLDGQYAELRAEFAAGAQMVINLDRSGRMFFQSPESQCVGNGVVTPHANAQFGVFDVILQIENCAAERTYLNGEYSGLLVLTPSDYWNYDDLLRMLLTKSGSPAVAISSLGAHIY